MLPPNFHNITGHAKRVIWSRENCLAFEATRLSPELGGDCLVRTKCVCVCVSCARHDRAGTLGGPCFVSPARLRQDTGLGLAGRGNEEDGGGGTSDGSNDDDGDADAAGGSSSFFLADGTPNIRLRRLVASSEPMRFAFPLTPHGQLRWSTTPVLVRRSRDPSDRFASAIWFVCALRLHPSRLRSCSKG